MKQPHLSSLAGPLLLPLLLGCADEPTAPSAPTDVTMSSARVGEHGSGAPLSVVFHSDRDGNREIYRMHPDGGGVERVTFRQATSDFYPDISPNGKWIVFTSVAGTGPGDIYIISSSGGEAVNLTNTPTVNEDWARWSPNGQQIAFHRGPVASSELFILDLASETETRLTDNAVDDAWPEWSPDGKRLAFRRNQDIHILDLDDPANVLQLTTDPALDQMAAWSPNGKQLAFMSFREGYCSVFTMDADGSDQQNLTPRDPGDSNSAWCSRAPSWTHDGRILFMSSRPGTQATAIFVMDADGTDLTLLTDAAGEDGGPTAR